jgi:hypothetical protein
MIVGGLEHEFFSELFVGIESMSIRNQERKLFGGVSFFSSNNNNNNKSNKQDIVVDLVEGGAIALRRRGLRINKITPLPKDFIRLQEP